MTTIKTEAHDSRIDCQEAGTYVETGHTIRDPETDTTAHIQTCAACGRDLYEFRRDDDNELVWVEYWDGGDLEFEDHLY